MLLLFLVMGFGFSGYLLPWNTLSFFATKVGTDITGQIPLIGHPMMVFLRGGEDVTGATLTRFFAMHVAVLPMVTTFLILMHIALVQRHGMSAPPSVERDWEANPASRREMKFFPNFFLREMMAWYVALGTLGALAALAPWELGAKADPFLSAPAGIKPEWYFLFMFQTLKVIPARLGFLDGELVGILAFGAAGLIWTLVPFLPVRDRSRTLITGAGIFALGFFCSMTVYGYFAK
jgi:cytochrome b6